MNIEFADATLQHRYESSRDAERAWGVSVARAYIRQVRFIMAAPTILDIYNRTGLRLHALSGNREGQHATRLPGGMRLVIRFDASTNSARIIEVVNYHD